MIKGVQQGSSVRLVAIRQASVKRAQRSREAVSSGPGWPTVLFFVFAVCCYAGGFVEAQCHGTGITLRCVGNGPGNNAVQPRVRQIIHRAPGWFPRAADLQKQFPRLQVSTQVSLLVLRI
jgi:hypothetical protein